MNKPREFWITKGDYEGDEGMEDPFYSVIMDKEEYNEIHPDDSSSKEYLIHVMEIPDTQLIKKEIKEALMFGPAFGLEQRLEEVLEKWFGKE